MLIVFSIVAAVVVYALAFDYTEVDLAKTSSETRQQSLTRILRALARPELVTYDQDRVITSVDVAVPCGAPTPNTSNGGISVSPACVSPGEKFTIVGEGFDAGEQITLSFVPNSEFDITLPLGFTQAESDGTFVHEATAPKRASDETQRIEVVTNDRIGSWANRVEIWTDTNENGLRDPDSLVGETVDITFEARLPETPAVALVNGSDVVEFVSFGEGFIAQDGLANRETALPVEEITFDADALAIKEIAQDGGNAVLTLTGPDGFEMTGWRAALYDADSGELVEATGVSDLYQLSPRISETLWVSLDRIIETVFLALIATTAGLLLAIPLSFVSARNIMEDISSTVTNLALGILAVPVGAAIGIGAARLARSLTEPIRSSALFDAIGIGILVWLIRWMVHRWVPSEDAGPMTPSERAARIAAMVAVGAVGLFTFVLFSDLLGRVGDATAPLLGPFDFLAQFFSTLGEIFDGGTSVVAALATAGLMVNMASRTGYALRRKLGPGALGVANTALAIAAGAVFAIGLMQVLDWFYRFGDPNVTLWGPMIIGGSLGLLMAFRARISGQVNVGLSTYYVARTIFNTLRATEPLVMAIVFVVWVGIGPFAGSLALTLHTAAALSKLYSEQVESISTGPIEAVRATGATRLQTIVYGVVPQIVPPYISFTMYRWDINVRMSTILGFVGGGGIGLILQQNVNLLQYRAAAVQMLLIAIVVASMDYLSSQLRRRLI